MFQKFLRKTYLLAVNAKLKLQINEEVTFYVVVRKINGLNITEFIYIYRKIIFPILFVNV